MVLLFSIGGRTKVEIKKGKWYSIFKKDQEECSMEKIESLLGLVWESFSKFLPLIGSFVLFRLRFLVVKKAAKIILSIAALVLLVLFLFLFIENNELLRGLFHGTNGV